MDCYLNTLRDPEPSLLKPFFCKIMTGIALLAFACCGVYAEENTRPIPRVVLAFYDSQLSEDKNVNSVDELIFRSSIHQSGEMPLNHLGLKIRYHDIQAPLPSTDEMHDVRGVLLWLPTESVPKPNALLNWLIEQIQNDRPVVVMGSHAFENSSTDEKVDKKLVQQFWNLLGLEKSEDWALVTYDLQLKNLNEKITAFESSFNGVIPKFPKVKIRKNETSPYLQAVQKSGIKLADLVAIGPNGAYVAPAFDRIFSMAPSFEKTPDNSRENKYWFINPFRFFALAFNTDSLPKPDTTTLSGRRIYYSHVDGDGWRNLSLIPKYREDRALSSEVILKEILLNYPNLPVTVAPVAGDLDSSWFGTEKAQQVARDIFKLPNIEAGSHTYSHPLAWGFFEAYQPEFEAAFLEHYPKFPGHSVQRGLQDFFSQSKKKKSAAAGVVEEHNHHNQVVLTGYTTPRAYYNGPYDLRHDIESSSHYIGKFLPEGKQVKLLQWSGDALPFTEALQITREAGMRNLNGGDTRFDAEFDSLNWVSPIGRSSNGEQQIYASASNENTYTNLWTDRFYGYGYLRETFKRTETPIRLKPLNVYYHMFIGERQASLRSLKNNLDYVQSKPIAPVTATQFAEIGEGFYTTQFEKIAERRWRVLHRGKLQTIRFDNATFEAIDFINSEGVIGQSHLQGSLYIALDPKHSSPVISLKTIAISDREPKAESPYLISGRWRVEAFEKNDAGFEFKVEGFGEGHMSWYIPQSGHYKIIVEHADGAQREWLTEVGEDHWLDIQLNKSPIQASSIKILKEREHNAGA